MSNPPVAPAVLTAVKNQLDYALRAQVRYTAQQRHDRAHLDNSEAALMQTLQEVVQLEAFLLHAGVSPDEIAKMKTLPNPTL